MSIVQRECGLSINSSAGDRHVGTAANVVAAANLTVDGITINVPSLPAAVSSIVSAAQRGDNFSVCTLNLDHVVQLQQHANFRAAYRRARFVTADGFPIVVLSRLMGIRIERTTGADLVEPVCAGSAKERSAGVSAGLERPHARRDGAASVGTIHRDCRSRAALRRGRISILIPSEADAAIERIRASGARLCFVALGAPRQELFAARCLDELNGTGVLCIGAALDFIAGTQTRAPSIAQQDRA